MGLDLACWGLGVDMPTSVVLSDAKQLFDDDQVTPDTQVVCYEYPGLTLMSEHRTWSPTAGTARPLASNFMVPDGSGHCGEARVDSSSQEATKVGL